MAKNQPQRSKYNLRTQANAEHDYTNRYNRASVKTKKELFIFSGIIGLAALYTTESILLLLKLSFSKLTSGNLVANLVGKVAPSSVDQSKLDAVTNASRAHVSVFDIIKFLFGVPSVGIALLSWTIALVVTIIAFAYLHSGNRVLQDREQVRNEMLDENDRYASDVPSLIKENGTDIAMDAKAVVLPDVSAIMAHYFLNPSGIKGKDGNVKIDTTFQKELQSIAQLSSKRNTFDGLPETHTFNGKDLVYDVPRPDAAGKLQFARDKSSKANTVAEAINNSIYVSGVDLDSPQGISGFYLVTTKPVNTTLIAATRAGKGQKYIEPIIDIWMRQVVQPNILATDPKGELLRKNTIALAKRGYDVKSLNTLNPEFSAAYNLYSYALMASDRGNSEMTARLLTNIGDVLFTASGDDAFWYGSASKLVTLGVEAMIDCALEDARRIRLDETIPFNTRVAKVDNAFGEVSAANVVHFINQLYATKVTDMATLKLAGYEEPTQALWVFLSLISKLPQTELRKSISSDFSFLQAQAGSEKMMSSILTIALQNMAFFREEAITKVTSGNPSKTLDFIGLGFPRRFSIWFDDYFIDLNVLSPAKIESQFFRDKELKKPYTDTTIVNGKDVTSDAKYKHTGEFDKGWVHVTIPGKLDQKVSYLRVNIYSTRGRLVDTFTFEFTKGYLRDATGNTYERDKISGNLIEKDGTLREYHLLEDGELSHIAKTFERTEVSLADVDTGEVTVSLPYVKQTFAVYNEKPVALFLVAPPQEVTYNRLAIMVIDAAFNEQFGYGVKNPKTPKPFVATKYMLDEFGNIVSNGKGIPDMKTKLSIGLSMLQQFTLVLQSYTQIDVLYSKEERDLMLGNTNATIFLKSTSDDVIKEVSSLGGTHRKHEIDSLNEEFHLGDMKQLERYNTSGRISTTTRVSDKPAIPDNVFKSLGEVADLGEAITYSGSTQTLVQGAYALPMAYKLLEKRPGGAEDTVSMSTLPLYTPNAEFDISKNVPNYMEKLQALAERVALAVELQTRWKARSGITEDSQIFASDMTPERYNNLIMTAVFDILNPAITSSDLGELTDDQIDRLENGKEIQNASAKSLRYDDAELNARSIKHVSSIDQDLRGREVKLVELIKKNAPDIDISDIMADIDTTASIKRFDGDVLNNAYTDPELSQHLEVVETQSSHLTGKRFANHTLSLASLDSFYHEADKTGDEIASPLALAIVNAALEAKTEFEALGFSVPESSSNAKYGSDFTLLLNGRAMIEDGRLQLEFVDYLTGTSSVEHRDANGALSAENPIRFDTWIDRGLAKFDKCVADKFEEFTQDT